MDKQEEGTKKNLNKFQLWTKFHWSGVQEFNCYFTPKEVTCYWMRSRYVNWS